MIEDPPVLTVRHRFDRPTADQVAALTGVPTGQLVDAMGGRAALDYRIKPVLDRTAVPCTFAGIAVTCHAGPADNLALWGALVTDGLARDLDGMTAVGIPVFCRGISPDSPARNGPGTAGLPITLGGATVDSGDVIAGDRDGVVVIPRARIADVIEALGDVRAAEADLEQAVRDGLEMPDFARTLLASDRVKTVE